MATATTPTWTSTISAAMIEAGRYNVSFSNVSDMEARGAQDVLTEIWEASGAHLLLTTQTLVLMATGDSTFTLPQEFDHEVSLRVFYGGSRYRAQTGTNQQITLADADTSSDDAYNGRYVFLLDGTGENQWNQITRYTGATRIASLSWQWTTPSSDTDYHIPELWWDLERNDQGFAYRPAYTPSKYQIVGRTLTTWPPADKMYPIILTWRPNLTLLDVTATLFIQWLRFNRSLVVQGIKVKTMALHDDDRYQGESQKWELMKQRYGGRNVTYTQTPFGSR